MGLFDKKEKRERKESKISNYLDGYNKTNKSLASKITELFGGATAIDDDLLEQLLVVLIQADVGVVTSEKIIEMLKTRIAENFLTKKKQCLKALMDVMTEVYNPDSVKELSFEKGKTKVIMMVGVNGSGKTTSISKIANYYMQQGFTVGLIAADTFRAGAVDQLVRWAERLNIKCVSGKENADPASVMVDGCRYFKENPVDIIIADTAGRLQNKKNLMNELSKMKRVTAREIEGAPHEIWLTIDATTGQNGLSQAAQFIEATDITGVILTKMDGTSKGGIVLAIKDQFNLPVRFITYGEDIESITEFWLEGYLQTVIEEAED
ncbi:MAG: signal recognition particle-docking protein FtsY [Erysipelotrichaceae bacterium]|nr:signal recognition particle-docking protein FtsY [Erysipelotrichaceae bacterium]